MLRGLDADWLHRARPDQLPPEGDWTTWAVIGGRGCGKTRAGAEWVDALARGDRAFTPEPVGRIALVGETLHDVRDVMIEGESGLLNLPRRGRARPLWLPSRRRVVWDNGAMAQAFSAEEADSLRGPQFGAAWCDEIAKWREAEAAFDMLQFGLRLGARPRSLVTTTPRPIPLIRRLLSDPRTVVTRARTHDNADNLAPDFLSAVVGRYAGNAARAAGTRWRTHRRPPGCSLVTGGNRGVAGRCGAGPVADRRGGGSACEFGGAFGFLRDRRRRSAGRARLRAGG